MEIQLNLIQAKTNRLEQRSRAFANISANLFYTISLGENFTKVGEGGSVQKILQLNKSLKSGHSKSGHNKPPQQPHSNSSPIVRRRGKFINNNSMPTQEKHNALEYLGHNLMST